MNKKELCFALLCIVAILQSCTTDKKQIGESTFNSFPKELQLSPTDIKLEQSFSLVLLSFVTNSYYVIYDMQPIGENCIYIYNKDTYDFLGSTGKTGEGPNEISNQHVGFQHSIKSNTFCVYDRDKKGIWEYNLDSAVTNADFPPVGFKPIVFPKNVINIIMTKEGQYLFNNLDRGKGQLVGLNNGNKLRYVGKNIFEPEDNNVHESFIAGTNSFDACLHPDSSKFAVCFSFSPEIRSYAFDGKLLFCKKGPDKFEIPQYLIINGKKAMFDPTKTKSAYLRCVSDDKFIYTGYNGSIGACRIGSRAVASFPQTILIFTWDGEAVAKINTGVEFCDLAIDKKGETTRLILRAVSKQELNIDTRFAYIDITDDMLEK